MYSILDRPTFSSSNQPPLDAEQRPAVRPGGGALRGRRGRSHALAVVLVAGGFLSVTGVARAGLADTTTDTGTVDVPAAVAATPSEPVAPGPPPAAPAPAIDAASSAEAAQNAADTAELPQYQSENAPTAAGDIAAAANADATSAATPAPAEPAAVPPLAVAPQPNQPPASDPAGEAESENPPAAQPDPAPRSVARVPQAQTEVTAAPAAADRAARTTWYHDDNSQYQIVNDVEELISNNLRPKTAQMLIRDIDRSAAQTRPESTSIVPSKVRNTLLRSAAIAAHSSPGAAVDRAARWIPAASATDQVVAQLADAARRLAARRGFAPILRPEPADIAGSTSTGAGAPGQPRLAPGDGRAAQPPAPRASAVARHHAIGVRTVVLVAAAPAADAVVAAEIAHPIARLRRVIPAFRSLSPGFRSLSHLRAPPPPVGSGRLTDARRLLQLGLALALAYLLFLMVWFWGTRGRHRGTGGRTRV